VQDLNIKTYLSILVGVSFMEIYAVNLVYSGTGYMFLFTNTISLILAIIMCGLIIKFRNRVLGDNKNVLT
jgi:MtN3 and saliva related transmembrane protein